MQTFNLWHLFSLSEEWKLPTFLRGGLWCSELSGIPSFEGDVEGAQAYGTFVSCWHKSEDDPTPAAWTILGDHGAGIAIGGSLPYLQSVVRQIDGDWLTGRLGDVRYITADQPVTDPAFDVRSCHKEEREMRVAFSIRDASIHGDQLRRNHVREHSPFTQSESNIAQCFEGLTFVEDQDALVVPISPRELFKQVLFGPKVPKTKQEATQRLIRDAGVACPFRNLS